MSRTVHPATRFQGEAEVPGDKSITHRALLLGAIASGTTRVSGYLDSGDSRASLGAVRALGVELEQQAGAVTVRGAGIDGLVEPGNVVDCVGSGTTMRLLAGLLAGYDMTVVLTGNEALRRRPMARVVTPLRLMGATVLGRDGDRLPPLTIRGGGLSAVDYALPVASAQVKSCVMLAGLRARGTTVVREPAPTRDHTERMLAAMGGPVTWSDGVVSVEPVARLEPVDIVVPGDLSSAAFLVAAALLVPGSGLRVRRVGVNPTRTGIIDIVRAMGGRLVVEGEHLVGGEPVADLVVQHSSLRATSVSGALVPLAIDELPLVAVLATQAEGVTVVRDAAELRVKESDRVASLVSELSKMGAKVEAAPDGFRVEGPTRLRGATVGSHADHRLAMALAVAALVADGPVTIEGAEASDDSFPGYFGLIEALQR